MKSFATILSLGLAPVGALAAPVAEPDTIARRGVLKRASGPLPVGDYTITRSIKAVKDTAKRDADADSSWWVWIPNQQYDPAKEKRDAADADSAWWVYVPRLNYDAASKEKREAADADSSWWVYIPNLNYESTEGSVKRDTPDADSSWWVYIPNLNYESAS